MSSVVVVKLAQGLADSGVDTAAYRRLLEIGLATLVDTVDLKTAVASLLPRGTIGFKASCLARKFNSTPVALVDAMTGLLINNGYDANDLVVWERTSRELAEAGFTLNASSQGVRCLGTDANGVGYSSEFSTHGEVSSLVSRILTEMVEQNVNLPVLKHHSIAGLSAGMKNMYGAIHNPNKFHANGCDPFCAQVSCLEPIRSKHRLTIIDAVRVQYDGGPGYSAQYMATFGALVFSRDSVAADRVGLEILERLRKDHNRPTLAQAGREVKYLKTATTLGLGESELERIDLKVLVVDELSQVSAGELFG
jgi:uncharacterized protein (DUF362 family)